MMALNLRTNDFGGEGGGDNFFCVDCLYKLIIGLY